MRRLIDGRFAKAHPKGYVEADYRSIGTYHPLTEMRYLLASTSRRRFDIMAAAGMTMVVQTGTPAAEVTDADSATAIDVTRINAIAKLRSVMKSTRGRSPWDMVMLAADTLVHRGDTIYGKPAHLAQARQMLEELRGTSHCVTTTVAMTYAPLRQRNEVLSHSVTSQIQMRRFTNDEREQYLASGLWKERAGSYGVQDAEFHPTESVDGCYLNVVGLPLCAVLKMLPEGDYPFVQSHIYATCTAHTGRVAA